MKKVILDTNFLIIAYKNKFDVIDELKNDGFEVFVIDRIVKELEKLKARLVLKILDVKNVNVLKTDRMKAKGVDPILVKFDNKGYIIATLDRKLKKKLKKWISLRKGKKLVFFGFSKTL